VVDDAIVVLENVTRYIEDGLSPLEAALKGANEVGFTVLSMSISLIAVFIPILLMGGIVGRLFREFAMTISISILISLAISLATTPMMCAVLLRGEPHEGHAGSTRSAERFFDAMLNLYRRIAELSAGHPRSVIADSRSRAGLNFYLYDVIPKGFFRSRIRADRRHHPGGPEHLVSTDAADGLPAAVKPTASRPRDRS